VTASLTREDPKVAKVACTLYLKAPTVRGTCTHLKTARLAKAPPQRWDGIQIQKTIDTMKMSRKNVASIATNY
jgi:hypothetical protein